jgi:peroxiredoxin
VFGISSDTAFAQAAWAKQENIAIPLVSDYEKTLAEPYGIVLNNLAGLGRSNHRAAFVIDSAGRIRYSEQTPTPLELPNFDAIRATIAEIERGD